MIDIDQLEHLVPGYSLTDMDLHTEDGVVTLTMQFKNTRPSLLRQVLAEKQISELEPFLKKSYD